MIHIDEWLLQSIQSLPSGFKQASALSKAFTIAIDDQLFNLEQSFHLVPAIMHAFHQLEQYLADIHAMVCTPPFAVGDSFRLGEWWRRWTKMEGMGRLSSPGCVSLRLVVASCRNSTAYLRRVLDFVNGAAQDLDELKNLPAPHLDTTLMQIEGNVDVMIRENIVDLELYQVFARRRLPMN
jgi:hypothetical protein